MPTNAPQAGASVPFNGKVLPGQYGPKVLAVTRALARAGHGKLRDADKWMSPLDRKHLVAFQRDNGIWATGLYGKGTHKRLAEHFDEYSQLLYSAPRRPPADIQLPRVFTPTHQTLGLPGYGAVDVFAKPGATVGAPEAGLIRRLSGKSPTAGGPAGGAYGWSMYLSAPSGDYFLTHFAVRNVKLMQQVRAGDILGTVCDAKVAGMPSRSSHIHCAKREL